MSQTPMNLTGIQRLGDRMRTAKFQRSVFIGIVGIAIQVDCGVVLLDIKPGQDSAFPDHPTRLRAVKAPRLKPNK